MSRPPATRRHVTRRAARPPGAPGALVASAALAAWLAAAAAFAAPATPPAPRSDEARLRERLSPEVAEQVLGVVREARAAGLPTDPLVGRALEGASRRVDGAGIVAEVRRQSAALASARAALGAGSSASEVVAGASALLAGVPADSLVRLRAEHTGGSLVIPLVVLCDFVARGVTIEAAAGSVLTAARAGVSDAALMRMREKIHDRIEHGAAPTGATRDVLRLWLQGGPRPPARAGDTGRPPPGRRSS